MKVIGLVMFSPLFSWVPHNAYGASQVLVNFAQLFYSAALFPRSGLVGNLDPGGAKVKLIDIRCRSVNFAVNLFEKNSNAEAQKENRGAELKI
jgi:hypothetical protein